MKHLLFIFAFILASTGIYAQKDSVNIYNPKANAAEEIQEAVTKAAKEHKHVFLTVGGNWCIWCKRFNNFVLADTTLNKALNDNYVVVHVNFSDENKNLPLLEKLGFPQRFGFPVFLVLDEKGDRIHTQNSGLLELDKGYNKDKVLDFFNQWTYAAVHPAKSPR